MARSDEDDLKKLNMDTFQAEDEPSTAESVLKTKLTNDFRIVRGIFATAGRPEEAIENREAMSPRVSNDTSGRKRSVSSENVMVYGDSAVVTSLVVLRERDGTTVGHYWNTKVCVRQGDEWKVRSWQVASLPR